MRELISGNFETSFQNVCVLSFNFRDDRNDLSQCCDRNFRTKLIREVQIVNPLSCTGCFSVGGAIEKITFFH